jgi:hypothetical protein
MLDWVAGRPSSDAGKLQIDRRILISSHGDRTVPASSTRLLPRDQHFATNRWILICDHKANGYGIALVGPDWKLHHVATAATAETATKTEAMPEVIRESDLVLARRHWWYSTVRACRSTRTL